VVQQIGTDQGIQEKLANPLLQMNNNNVKVYTPWRNMIQNTFKYDPLKCPRCNNFMIPTEINIPLVNPINSMFHNIANGHYPLL
jgi:hypothetical protein